MPLDGLRRLSSRLSEIARAGEGTAAPALAVPLVVPPATLINVAVVAIVVVVPPSSLELVSLEAPSVPTLSVSLSAPLLVTVRRGPVEPLRRELDAIAAATT